MVVAGDAVSFGNPGDREAGVHGGQVAPLTPWPEGDLALRADHSLASRYRELLDRVPAIVYIAEPGELGRWLFVGAQIEVILGYSAEEWRARPELWAERLHQDDRALALEREHEMELRGGGAFTDEYRMIHRDGHLVWLRDDARLLRDPDGRMFWHGVMVDVTSYKTLGEQLQLHSDREAAVAALGERALEGVPADELLRAAAVSACALLGADAAVIADLVDGCESVQPRCIHPESDGTAWLLTAAGPDTPAGQALLTRTPVIVGDWDDEPRFTRPEAWAAWSSSACVAVEGARRPFGVFSVHSQTARTLQGAEISFLQALANVLADALDRRTTEDEIRHRALHDPLTELPNRVLLEDRLQHALAQARRHGEQVALLFLDLDHFKVINDSLGHQTGDQVLTAVAAVLKRALRASDTVARIGGDEFALLLEQVHSADDAITMAERIRQLLIQPLTIAGREHFVSFSVGIALGTGVEDADELVRNADMAMYRAKERGRSQFAVFDRTMRRRLLVQLRLEGELRHALEREELTLEYQPIVTTGDARLSGVEALLRWDSGRFGRIGPADFIPLAEQSGLIEPIWNWVLRQACAQTAAWAALTDGTPAAAVSVNLSPVQIPSPTLVSAVRETLLQTGIAPQQLCIEITETAMLREPSAAGAVLSELSALGVRFALDDFGTGFSSLTHLSQLHLDRLKIDRTFVAALGGTRRDDAIGEAILSMARALSIEVVAEGVETAAQAQHLGRLGCQLSQGYLFSPPLPAEALTARLELGPPWTIAPGAG